MYFCIVELTIYFADNALCFAESAPAGDWYVLAPDNTRHPRAGGDLLISRTTILTLFETHPRVAVVSTDYSVLFERFSAEFTHVEAAGGVVTDARGRWLMIFRNGRWDFPKGHVEAGETFETTAEREIAEETGVTAQVVAPLCETLHAYYFEPTARWELKRTHWFSLRAVAASDADLNPQTEEGITRAVWCAQDAVAENLREAFPTIQRVAEAMKG